MAFSGKRIAIDFGSSTTRIYVTRRGLILEQPTIIARDEVKQAVVGVGEQAQEMLGRSPETITLVHPLQFGVIADYKAATQTLRLFLQESLGRVHIRKPEAMITVSASATSTERKALVDAGREAGLAEVHLIESAVAAGLGAGLPISEPRGSMIVDIGNNTTEVGIFSLGGIVAGKAVRIGGSSIDEAIVRFLRREHSIIVGSEDIFDIKSKFLNLAADQNHTMTVHGQNTIQGQPKSVTIKHGQLKSYVEVPLEKVTTTIRNVLEKTPPDIISDIIKHGALLSGGSSQIKGLDEYLSKKINLACVVAQDPMLCSIKGAHIALTHLEDYQQSLLS